MTRRPPRVGQSRDGLFWNPTGADGEVQDNPMLRPCDRKAGGCGAGPREPCTSPSRRRGGRRPIKGYHQARQQPSANHTQEKQ